MDMLRSFSHLAIGVYVPLYSFDTIWSRFFLANLVAGVHHIVWWERT